MHMHIGSQITTLSPFGESVRKVIELIDSVQKWTTDIKYLDVGGGFPASYIGQDVQDMGIFFDIISLLDTKLV